jgi:hypothetical protein
MEKLGIHGAEKAYNLLRPYAFKKDLFQWMALWQYGGFFIDVKIGLETPITDWIDLDHEEFVICASEGSMSLDNAFVAMTKHHPYGLMMVQNIIDNVNERAYYDGDQSYEQTLNITGPASIRSLFIRDHQLTLANIKCLKNFRRDRILNETSKEYYYNVTSFNFLANNTDKVLMRNDPVPGDKVWDKMKTCTNCNNYNELSY